MAASAAARGSPATAGVGCSSGGELERGRRRRAAAGRPPWWPGGPPTAAGPPRAGRLTKPPRRPVPGACGRPPPPAGARRLLGRRPQLGHQPAVLGLAATPPDGAGHGPRHHHRSRRRMSSSGLAPTNPPACEREARRVGAPQPFDDRRHVERWSPHTVTRRASTTFAIVPRPMRSRARRRCRPVDAVAVDSTTKLRRLAAAATAATAGGRRPSVAGPISVTHACPSRLRRRRPAGTTSSPSARRGTGWHPCDRAGPGQLQRIVDVDLGQQGRPPRPPPWRGVRAGADRDAGRHPRRREPGPLVQPDEPAGTERGDRSGAPSARSGYRPACRPAGVIVRVPVSSWAMPVDSGVRRASGNPDPAIIASSASSAGR